MQLIVGGGLLEVVSCWFVPQMRIIVEGELGGEAKLFKPLMFRSQVVRGVHYIIKVWNVL